MSFLLDGIGSFFMFFQPVGFLLLLFGSDSSGNFDISLEGNISLASWFRNLRKLWPSISVMPVVLVNSFSFSVIG
jgi:hypothetical protein